MKLIPIADRKAWLESRRKNVGGSEVAALFGCQPAYAMSAWTLWQVKAGRLGEPDEPGERAAWGLRLEAAIADAAAGQEGWTIAKAGYCPHPDVAGMACSLDYLIVAGEPGRSGQGVLEIKNVDWLQERRRWGGEPPEHILLQLQHQLACAGLEWGAVAALVGGNRLEIYRYERRPRLIAEIEKRVADFWASIAEGREPPTDGSASTARGVARLWPHDDGEEQAADLSADNELPDLCDRYLQAAAARRADEALEREAKSGILAKLGGHKSAWCEGYAIRAPEVEATPDKTITAEMVGQTIKGRAGYRRLTVKEREGPPAAAQPATSTDASGAELSPLM